MRTNFVCIKDFTSYTLYVCVGFICCFLSCTTAGDMEEEPLIIVGNPSFPNIDVYESDLFERSYVMGIKNGSKEAFLIDKRGEKVYEWLLDTNLGNDLELLSDGKLLGMFKTENPAFSFGGYGGIVKILNIDATTNWEYEYASDDFLAHHDVELLKNGNILFLVWEKISANKAQEAGVNTTVDIYPEVLIEVDPKTNEIVWEWHSFDHLIQDKFPEIPTYGVLKDNPQRIDFNYNLRDNGDIMHANGIDHDAVKDVIYISVNFYSEVWVIDHSTTKEEAMTNSGGNYNKGGDLLYRFGNPETYDNTEGQRLFYNNHFPNILENGEPGEGNVLIYVNSGDNIEQSTIYELIMPNDFNLEAGKNNEPEIEWSFTDPELFHQRISGAVRLKNGNTLISEGDYGFWEVTPAKQVVWKYNGMGDSFWRCYAYDINSNAVKSLGL